MNEIEKNNLKKVLSDEINSIITNTFVNNIVDIVEIMEDNLPDSVPEDTKKGFIDNFINSQISLIENTYKIDVNKFKDKLRSEYGRFSE